MPYLEEATGGIPVREIVLRVKCELSDAFMALDSERIPANDVADWWGPEQPKYAWLQDWTAQADLTLQVVDTASIAPGASFTEPLPNGWNSTGGVSSLYGKSISSVTQNFMVAAGANLGGQSQRIETMSIVFSLKELEEWRKRDKERVERLKEYGVKSVCELSDKMDLAGRLGLKEWLGEALSPVEKQDGDAEPLLYANYHPKPGQAAVAPPKAGTAFQPINPKPPTGTAGITALAACKPGEKAEITKEAEALKTTINSMQSKISLASKAKTSAESTRTKVTKLFESVSAWSRDLQKLEEHYHEVLPPERIADAKEIAQRTKNIENIGDTIKDNVDIASKLADRVGTDISNGISSADKAIALANNDDCINAAIEKSNAELYTSFITKDADNAKKNADIAIENYNNAVSPANELNSLVSKLQTINPPIASVGQNVQFIVNYGGNVTPTWNFVRFKGPNAPLLGAQGMRTHILNISLGPSAAATPGAPAGASPIAPGGAVTASNLNLLLTTLLPARPF